MEKFKRFICKTFGHKFSWEQLLMAETKKKASNREELRHGLICERCGMDFTYDWEDIEKYMHLPPNI